MVFCKTVIIDVPDPHWLMKGEAVHGATGFMIDGMPGTGLSIVDQKDIVGADCSDLIVLPEPGIMVVL